jgi:hypothetical protein
VLKRLQVKLRTLTPPPSTATRAALAAMTATSDYILQTPYNVIQLETQANALKQFLKRRIQSPPSPSDQALDQLIKGCHMAMHNAVLLASENTDLQVANQRQKRKRNEPRRYIARGGILTVEEGKSRAAGSSNANEEAGLHEEVAEPAPKRRRPPKCSVCGIVGHTARTCSDR